MNDQDFERIFRPYRDSLGTARQPVSRRQTNRRPMKWAVVATAVTLAAATVSLWPSNAGAKALAQMTTAIKNAHSMELVFERQTPSGAWTVFDRERYSNGMWRYDVVKGTGLHLTGIRKDGRSLLNYDRLSYATLRPENESDEKLGEFSALDYAKSILDSGHTDQKRTVSVEHHSPINGVEVYALILERPEDHYRAEILVDSKTNYPISADCTLQEPNGPAHFRQTYRFNLPLETSLFEGPTDKPVLDVIAERRSLATRWKTPLAKVEGTKVWDACATTDGTIWLLVSQNETKPYLPTSLRIAGQSYLRLYDLPNHATHQEVSLDGQDASVIGFVPERPTPSSASKIDVGFVKRDWDTGLSEDRKADPPADQTISLPLRQEPTGVPNYFAALGLEKTELEMPVLSWDTRGWSLNLAGRYREAAEAYRKCADAYRDLVVYAGYRPLRKAAACYDRAGLPREAAAARKEAEVLLASKER